MPKLLLFFGAIVWKLIFFEIRMTLKICTFSFYLKYIATQALRTLYLHLKRLYRFLRTPFLYCFFSGLVRFAFFLKFKFSTNKSF